METLRNKGTQKHRNKTSGCHAGWNEALGRQGNPVTGAQGLRHRGRGKERRIPKEEAKRR